MSDSEETKNKPVLREELAELERRIYHIIDVRANAHDVTTQAHVQGLHARIDDLKDSMQKQFEGMQIQFEGVQTQFEGIQKQFEDIQKQFDRSNSEQANRFAWACALATLVVTVVIAVGGWIVITLNNMPP